MKLKYILPLFVAALAFLTGCSEDQDPTYLDGLRVSNSYVTIPLAGGTRTVEISADADWAIDPATVPAWLTVSPASGGAGTTNIAFTASVGTYGQVSTLKIISAGRVLQINVQQGLPTPELATCAEIAAGPDGKQFRVRGRVTSIGNTTYGNWYLEDATGSVYIYGTLDKDGKTKNFSSLNIEVGDVVTVEGPKKDYNGTIELIDVTVVKIEKTLVKIISEEPTVAKEGGEFEIEVQYKGIGLLTDIADDAKSWIHQTDIRLEEGKVTAVDPNPANKAFIKFKVDANPSDVRKGILEFKSMKDGNESSVTLTVVQKGSAFPAEGDGTAENPYNVTAALEAAVAGATDVYIKGIVSQAPTSFNESFGNLGYYISASGKQEEELQVFRGFSFNGEHFTSKDDIQLGDVVVIKGNLKMYNGAAEIDANNQLVTLNMQTTMEGINNPGSYRKPFDIAGVISFIDGAGTGNVFVKGVVSEVVNAFDSSYGNGTFWISDDGTKHGDPLKDFEAYRVYWLGNKKWAEGNEQIAVGSKVVLYGEVTKYKTTYETNQNKAYVFNFNGKVK